MNNVQRTIYAAFNQTCRELGIPITFPPYTTLNQALGILNNYTYPTNPNPILQYLVIGNGGSSFTTGSGGLTEPVPIQHQATDANLFSMLPFVLRTIDNDLTSEEMSAYRLRKEVTVNGTQYIAYYGFIINLTNIAAAMYSITTNNGVANTSVFTPDATNLSPQPQNLTSLSVNSVAGDYVNVNSLLSVVLTPAQITEFLNACQILYGNPASAIISEMGLCSGFDVTNTGTSNGSPISYTEAVGVQINAFINTFYAMYYSQNGLNTTFNVGATEPLMQLIPAGS